MSSGTGAYSGEDGRRGTVANHLHDLIEIFIMSVALGMDGFSLAVAIGLRGIRRTDALHLVLVIGFFHVFLTLVGINVGRMAQGVLGHLAQWLGAFILFGLGLHMLYATFFPGSDEDDDASAALLAVASPWAMSLFAAGVSLDALSIGFSLGLRSSVYGLVAAASFGVFSALLCGLGLLLGRRVGQVAGIYGELAGALILLGFGIHFLFN
ncbi:hypothetical protein D2Q93_11610 [Alicyclobacillaceae bacterium I2511]|nr:hypothetical protein D2Q93_11610 [Alicyclobacillaceae bacterium I2511]